MKKTLYILRIIHEALDPVPFYVGCAGNLRDRTHNHRGELRRGKHHARPLQDAFDRAPDCEVRIEALATFVEDEDAARAEDIAIQGWASVPGFSNGCRRANAFQDPSIIEARQADPEYRRKQKEGAVRVARDPEYRRKTAEAIRAAHAIPVEITFPDGRVERFDAIVDAASVIEMCRSHLSARLRGALPWPKLGKHAGLTGRCSPEPVPPGERDQ